LKFIHKRYFGLLPVTRSFNMEEEVLKLANDTSFGLMADVFTQCINKAFRVGYG
ncbi:hypothetical protein GQ53DRAFT_637675, partial [Thozetella sp. PMI_491]